MDSPSKNTSQLCCRSPHNSQNSRSYTKLKSSVGAGGLLDLKSCPLRGATCDAKHDFRPDFENPFGNSPDLIRGRPIDWRYPRGLFRLPNTSNPSIKLASGRSSSKNHHSGGRGRLSVQCHVHDLYLVSGNGGRRWGNLELRQGRL